ncbi:MAG TPA: putative Ig domain-containing protein, partial [Blastocatellia bacterium]|nr:putative Ig domain-containing protein [Blastocatellia bacterium]
MKRVLKTKWVKSLFLICLMGCAQTALATIVVTPTDDDMIIGARAIVRGKVVAIESSFDDQQTSIYTYITLRVQEVIKGRIDERRIILKQLGGRVGDRGQTIHGSPQFTQGEKVIVYLDNWRDGSLRVYQMYLGKFSVVKDSTTSELFAVRNSPDDNVTVLPGGPREGAITDRLELSAYIEMVRSRLAANVERSEAFYERYYRSQPALAQPPEYSRISAAGDFHPQWTYIGSAHPRWFEPDSGQQVVFSVRPDGAPSGVLTDISAAMNAWSTVPTTSIRLALGGTTTSCNEGFGFNVIRFDGCDGLFGPPPVTPGCSSGTLAIGGLNWGGGGTKVINGVTFTQAYGGFISFNPLASCYFSDHCDVQEITTHELGHALGLGHSADSTATMYAYAHFDGRCASLRTDDVNGITFIYPASGGGGGPLTISTSSLPGATLNSSYNQSLIATGGTLPYSWSLVAGQGALPAGLSLSSSGVISGTPSATGTSNFTVKVTDAASGSAQKALSIVVATAVAPLDSQFVSQNVPTTLQPGQSFNANLKFLNTGTQTWSGSGYWLVSQNPALNTTWGGNGVPLSAYTVSQGQQLDVTFTAYAPSTPGTYNFQWQLYQNGGVGFFGQMSANLAIQVGNPVTIVTGSTLPSGTAGAAYSQTLGASGGTAPYTWSLIAGLGSLPGGLSVSSAGVINGTPNSAGTFNFTVQANDSASGWAQKGLSITIAAGGSGGSGRSNTVGLYNPATSSFFLRNANSSAPADLVFTYGPAAAGWVSISGDWNGDGVDTIGLYNPSTGFFFLRN